MLKKAPKMKDDRKYAGSKTEDSNTPPAEENVVFIEVFPGVTEQLRRTKETKEAIARDFYAPTTCFACNMDVFCIADVKYYICPQCKCVSLMEEQHRPDVKEHHGVGIAFGIETLFNAQAEIVRSKTPRSSR